ncbi:hypothetical protein [Candidatus Odyssella acanthamoebae]|uniref:DUF945 domain-containing protein n=1 Tax=Candidatus Odyssella acanthamoebae TaxID=91604 RepID=A0A077AZN5_9PROT|nr:hypothetical protein [Candidatus Paracaedibacter acanthamoebae]AIK96190.1 hypothetical protein ID47_04680 [Candidatus Paracaedibacter acanthamoebae]
MKKILLSAVGVCAVVAAAGYYLAVEKFATEAEYFKESLATSDMFKTKAVSIDKYKFQIVVDGLSIDLVNHLQNIPVMMPEANFGQIQLEINTPLKLQYTPILNKLTLLTPATSYEITSVIAGKSLAMEVEGDTGAAVLNLSHIPSLKGKSLTDFMAEYVDKTSVYTGHYILKSKGADQPMASVDQSHSLFTSEKSAVGKKVTYDYDTKGIKIEMGEIFKLIQPLLPKQPDAPNLSNFYAPIAGFTDAKRDMKGQVSFDGNISQIIADFKAMLASQGHVVDLFKSFMGSTVEATSEDLMLGSSLNTEVKIKLPQEGEETDAELKYRVDGEVSSQLQAVLPKAIFQRLKVIKPDIDLTEDAFQALTPNLVSLGKIVVDLEAKGNFEKKLGTAKLDVSTTDYGVYAKATVGQDNMVINVKVKNYDALLRDLQTYIQKVADHPEMAKKFTPEQKAQIPTYSELAKTTLKSMGKEEVIDGKPSIVIEQTIPTALLGVIAAGVPAAPSKTE